MIGGYFKDCEARRNFSGMGVETEEVREISLDEVAARYPLVGVGVMILKEGKVLLGRRKGSHGAAEYAGTGGHMNYMESLVATAKRETLEETGMEIQNVRLLCVMNMKDYAPRHYVDIGMVADWKSGEPQVMEPAKRESWNWFDLDNLPKPMFASMDKYIEAYKTGQNFWDQ